MRNKILRGLLLGVVAAVMTTACITTKERIIWGSVIDNNNRPVSGAIVTTDPPSSSVATDSLGRYLLKVEGSGNYSVNADMLGYVSDPIIVRVKKGDIIQADIRLLPEGLVSAPETLGLVPVTKEVAPAKGETAPVTEKAPEPAKKKKWWEK